MFNLSKNAKFTRVSGPVAAGQATTNSGIIDMQGFDSITFVAAISTIVSTGTVVVKVQEDDASNMATAADLLGSAVSFTDADDDKLAIIEIAKPQKRYCRAVVITATANGTIDSVIAIQSRATNAPVTHDATTVVGAELHHAPIAGTA